MKKLITLTKTLLVLAGLCVGVNAWAAKSVVGALDNTSVFFTEFSDYYTIEPNGTLTLSFTNYSDKAENFHNWIAAVTNDVDRQGTGYEEYLILRADNYGWGSSYAAGTLTSNYNWDTFKSDMDGANVVMKVKRDGDQVTVHADVTSTAGNTYYEEMIITAGDATQNIRFFLSTELGHIENLCEGAWNCVETLDFEDAETYTSGWNIIAGANTRSQIDHKAGKAMQVEADSNGSRDYYFNFATNNGFTTTPIWKIEFDFAGSTANTDQTRFYIYSAASGSSYGQFTNITKFFDITDGAKYTTTAKVYAGNTTEPSLAELTYSSYKTAISTWYHVTLAGNSIDNSVTLTIRDASDAIVLAETKVCDFANAKGMSIRAGKGLGKIALDDVKAYKMINPTITTKYQLADGTTLIDDIETEVITGNNFTPSYPASFQSGLKEYSYVSGGDEIASVTADQTVTIVYDEADMPEGTFYAETYEKNGGTTGWSTSTGGRYTPVILSNGTDKYLSVKQDERNNNGTTVTGTAWSGAVDKNTDFTMTFDLLIDAASTATSPLTFFDKDNSNAMLKLEATANDGQTWKINDNADQTVGLTWNVWYKLTYSRKGSLTYLTITKVSDNSSVLAQTQIATLSSDGGLGKVTFVTGRYNANLALDNVLIRAWQTGDTPEVTETTYTIKYQDADNNQLKEDVVNPTTVGTENIVATSDELASFYNNDKTKKYIYVSGNDPITAVDDADQNVIVLIFREAAIWNYTVKNNLGTTIAETSDFEDETIKVPYSRYELNDGIMYEKGTTNQEYRYEFTLTSDNQEETIDGYNDSGIANVLFFTEGENIEGATNYTAGNTVTRASNAKAATRGDNDLTVFENVAPGTYKLYMAYFKAGSGTLSNTFTIDGQDVIITISEGTNVVTAQSDDITIAHTSDIVWTAGNGPLDWFYIQKIADPQTATIGAAGYATFSCSDKALDFTNTDVKAYTASLTSDYTIVLKPATQVPANTGLVLAGAQGTYDIPVITEATAITGNLLKPSADEEIAASTDDLHHYVLAKRNDNVGFYNLATAKNIGAGKAYLETTVPLATTTGSRVAWIFADGTTGIKTTNLTNDTNETIYNLNGQRVAAPQKGLYIVNGKKVIMK